MPHAWTPSDIPHLANLKWYLTFGKQQTLSDISHLDFSFKWYPILNPPYKVYKKIFDKNKTPSLQFDTMEYKEIRVERCIKMKCKFKSKCALKTLH